MPLLSLHIFLVFFFCSCKSLVLTFSRKINDFFSVSGAITSVQHRLKLYSKVPPNGLVVYCGTIVTEEGKEKKVNIDFEPFKPINTSLYLCDNKFHTEALTALLADDNRFGFIVMDGNGALFGTLQVRYSAPNLNILFRKSFNFCKNCEFYATKNFPILFFGQI